MSAIAMVMGDLTQSLTHATHALNLADESGHARTRLAAAINIAQIMERRGDTETAKRHLNYAVEHAKENTHLLRAAWDSWANLLITSGRHDEARAAFGTYAKIVSKDPLLRPHWDAITELCSQARLSQAEGDWTGATDLLDQALQLSRTFDDHTWTRRIASNRARCLALSGHISPAILGVPEWADGPIDPESLGHFYGALAAIESVQGQTDRAAVHFRRATRIALGLGNAALSHDLRYGVALTSTGPCDPDLRTVRRDEPSHLDSAVALLELAGHPHILGREAFALLQETRCADAVALVATGPAGPRIVAADGWTEPAALAAVAAAKADDLVTLGQHRDETWQILATPRPGLDERCSLANIRKLLATARTLDQYRRDEKQRAALWPAESLDSDPESIWVSELSAELLTTARRIALSPVAVLLTGETGTGKEMLARAIHRASDRASRPFVPFNCTAVPREMLDSQLFGYRKGAFTGAEAAFPGVIRAAAMGTLFLDEIAEIGLDVQPKLLRFLDNYEIHPIGESQPVKVDVRIVAATNGHLEQLVADGRFREDLFYRLNVVRLRIPALRERREEIPPLVQHYLRKVGDEQHKGYLTLSDEALEYLLLYSWPGNIRQLANEVRRIVALAQPDATITPHHLSPEILASRRTVPASGEPEIRVRLDQPLPAAVELLEQMMVRRALERARGRVEEASRLLGISRKGLFLKRRRWGLRKAS